MRLHSGSRLGPYEIIGTIGSGAMGEVYRARDARLQRDVAIKVLPNVFAGDPDRLARFAREAQVLASLNHPNIAAIYGLEESDDGHALVMELVEGPTLAQCLGAALNVAAPSVGETRHTVTVGSHGERRKARGLALDEALSIARQIAEALEAAHENGIVHRDLKPANIKVKSDGTVKVLDFGLAKALPASDAAVSNSPTLSAATHAGVVLGTPAYMPPEQARGRVVDRRADIWAFGAVVYEMLTGHRAFSGEDITTVLAKVIEREPDWNALPADTPPWLRRLVARCLEKDPKRRLRDIGDARLEIEAAGAEPAGVAASAPAAPAERRRAGFGRPLTVGLAAFFLGSIVSGLATLTLKRDPQAAPRVVRRFALVTNDRRLTDVQAISPDGSRIAYIAGGRLWIRDLSLTTPREVPSSAGADGPFWSPDGELLGFRLNRALWKVTAPGGDVVKLCDLPPGEFTGATWGRQGFIVIGVTTGWSSGELYRVSAGGGTPEAFLKPDRASGELRFGSPHFLPDGESLLSTALRDDGTTEVALQRGNARTKVIRAKGDLASVAYSPTGHLLYAAPAEEPSLWAVSYDPGHPDRIGEPVRVVSDGSAPSVALDGTLVYSVRAPSPKRLVIVDRGGRVLHDVGETSDNARPAVSPDGNRIAHGRVERDNLDLWITEISGRGLNTRVTFDPASEHTAAWLPSGDRIAFVRAAGTAHIFITRADGGSEARLVVSGPYGDWGPEATPDGRHLLYYVVDPKTGRDLWYAPIEGGSSVAPFLKTPFEEALPAASPDGRFVAYQSNESGQWEVYVRPFPSGEGRWQVSVGGGLHPRWSPRGGELFYVAENRLVAVEVKTAPFTPGKPRILFSGDELGTVLVPSREPFQRRYDVMPDGRRFVVVTGAGYGTSEIVVVENWAAALR